MYCGLYRSYVNLVTFASMVSYVSVEDFFQLQQQHYPVLDIRTPGEYIQGHIPGADCFPLFDNEERRVVGTLYKQSGPEKAFLAGLDYAGCKMSRYVKNAAHYNQKNLLLHCWRGGKRSESMAWLLSQAGYNCYVLDGGYRAYRRYIRASLEKYTHFIVLGGMTGSNKTGMLHEMSQLGAQVIDLEGLANHKGSAFGHINEPEQPTTEQFENNLYADISKMDPDIPVWLEDESRTIGKVVLPDLFYKNKKMAPLLVVNVPKKERIMHLVEDYANIDDAYLYDALQRIRKRLGGDNLQTCMQALEAKDYPIVADVTLSYYDKAYNYAISTHLPENLFTLELKSTDPVEGAKKILAWYNDCHQNVQE